MAKKLQKRTCQLAIGISDQRGVIPEDEPSPKQFLDLAPRFVDLLGYVREIYAYFLCCSRHHLAAVVIQVEFFKARIAVSCALSARGWDRI